MIIIIITIIGRSMMPTCVDCTFRWNAPSGSDVLGLPVYHALLEKFRLHIQIGQWRRPVGI